MTDEEGWRDHAEPNPPTTRPAYAAPAVAWEEALDETTLAAACGKSNPSEGASCAASGQS